MARWMLAVLALLGALVCSCSAQAPPAAPAAPAAAPPAGAAVRPEPIAPPAPADAREGAPAIKLPPGVPAKVARVLAHVDEHGEAPEGYQGGRGFVNAERHLPQTDRRGRRIRYREWDVNPLRAGVNRGPERLVTGSDGSAWYTADHYNHFTRLRGGR